MLFLMIFLVVPLMAAILIVSQFNSIDDDLIPLIMAAFAVLAAVMTGLLPIVHGVVGQVQCGSFEPGQFPLVRRELDRIETLRELYSTISYAVIILVLGVVALVALALIPAPLVGQDGEPYGMWLWVRITLVGFTYFVAASTMASFFNIATGVYESLEDQAARAAKELESSLGPDRGGSK